MSSSYSVVHFFSDNSVVAVPKFWFSKRNGKCAWPKKPLNPKKLIEQNSIPNDIEYDFFDAREMATGIGKTNNCSLYNYLYYD